jgi:hypothetical protein
MSYGYCLEELLSVLRREAPTEVEVLSRELRATRNGLLSVGLKVHCTGSESQFARLVDALGGAYRILEINSYRQAQASMCLVLPPVGNARAAVLLLECIERFVGTTLFKNKTTQLQVCSPGRLDSNRSALLAICFYLGSDTLRRYNLGDLETSFSTHCNYPRGRRLVLYDAEGIFDRKFEWWRGCGPHRVVDGELPFENGRSDLLAGTASKRDVYNINLVASLLVHSQYDGYWAELGKEFQQEIEGILDKHLLGGLINAPWVRTAEPTSFSDYAFYSALQELVAYALDEASRVRAEERDYLLRARQQNRAPSSLGILEEVQLLLNKYRHEVANRARLLEHGARS